MSDNLKNASVYWGNKADMLYWQLWVKRREERKRDFVG